MMRRTSGILLHITSLPSPYGIGDLGGGAYEFANLLARARQSFWQILPLNPTQPGLGSSPYSSHSAFGGNPLLISPLRLVEEGFLDASDVESPPEFPVDRVDFVWVEEYKSELLKRAYEKNRSRLETDRSFNAFCREHAHWLEGHAHFTALKTRFEGREWTAWPRELRDRHPEALEHSRRELRDSIVQEKFLQYLFFRQWLQLKAYCNKRQVRIMGDLPIYVNHDSADVWAHRELFKLDENGSPTHVAGVPPDYFSETGQLWGNPVYRWDFMRERGFEWWVRRMEHNLRCFDRLRLDHFRGFVAYWEVPAGEETAINGIWVPCPVEDFFDALARQFPCLPLIAEDLGLITADVREVMAQLGFPGMKVVMFAFGNDMPTNPYIPHRLPENCVVYTGTHDNNTARGWFEQEAREEDRRRLFRYLGREVGGEEAAGEMVRLVMGSVGRTAMLPMQDVLGLGSEARMNVPATANGNWSWRLRPEQAAPHLLDKLKEMTETCGRG